MHQNREAVRLALYLLLQPFHNMELAKIDSGFWKFLLQNRDFSEILVDHDRRNHSPIGVGRLKMRDDGMHHLELLRFHDV